MNNFCEQLFEKGGQRCEYYNRNSRKTEREILEDGHRGIRQAARRVRENRPDRSRGRKSPRAAERRGHGDRQKEGGRPHPRENLPRRARHRPRHRRQTENIRTARRYPAVAHDVRQKQNHLRHRRLTRTACRCVQACG